ncbi:MAG: thioredoxin family protein [Gloeobacteraceae cyanobacterium ES-bin-144]|nr:thioredoxin family protein [Verrucomicrobiales bacterium]
MKILRTLLVFTLCLSVSCEKARSLISRFGKKTEATTTTPSPVTGPLVVEIPEGAFESFPKQAGRVVIIDYYADWCGPCRQISPLLEIIAAEKNGVVIVGKVNVDRFPAIAMQAGVQAIPDIRVYRDGKFIQKFVLPTESELRQIIDAQVKDLPIPTPSESAAQNPAVPLTQPMPKNWMPDGLKRR